ADLIENLVAFEEEAIGAAALNQCRLPRRQNALGNEELGEGLDAFLLRLLLLLPAAIDRFHLLGGKQLALGKERTEFEDVSGGCGHGRQRSEDRKQRTETEDGGQRTKRLLLIQNKKRFWISNHCPQHSPNLGAETN